jgi:hypothetical protein
MPGTMVAGGSASGSGPFHASFSTQTQSELRSINLMGECNRAGH